MSENPTLEQRMARLDTIVHDLEGDGLELEEALALFEEGVAQVREAERLLSESRLRVERLLEDETGRITAERIADAE
jgi:exodeoxyribonuclease VII small subunit